MEIRKSALLLAFFITLSLFLSIMLFGGFFSNKREEYLNLRFQEVYRDFDDLQKLMLISEVYGDEMACIAYKDKLQDFDKRLWSLGQKLEQYRAATEEVQKSEYYLEQKSVFNENEFTYLALLKQINKLCNFNSSIITFYYRNSKDCKKCDDQAFVLTDIKKKFGDEVAIFSFDLDLNITSLNLLSQFYKIEQLPCIVINEIKYCGIQDNKLITKKLCENNKFAVCETD